MNRIGRAYELLFEAFGEQHWWPAGSPWEVCTGAVLTQNTNWRNVDKALDLLKAHNALDPQKTLDMAPGELADLIRPSGFFRIKTVRLKAVAAWWMEHKESTAPTPQLRESLLAVPGVGAETADSILLYAMNRTTFVIDAYTRRISARHFGTAPDINYHRLQQLFTDNLPPDRQLFNEYHALLVRNAKEYCRKSECLPGCPLRELNDDCGNHGATYRHAGGIAG